MNVEEIPLDHQFVLNQSEKIIFNNNTTGHSVVTAIDSAVFPVAETYYPDKANFSLVTFIFFNREEKDIFLLGNFANLYTTYQLSRVKLNNSDTNLYAVTLKLPTRAVYFYQFKIDQSFYIDPLNSFSKTLDNGKTWSCFITEGYKTPLIFEEWEVKILQRFVSFVLPFKTAEFKTFVNRHSAQFDNTTRSMLNQLYYDIGVVNFIDKLLARQERHHVINYQLCLSEMKQVLLRLNNTQEPEDMDEYFYARLFEIMEKNDFSVWNKAKYDNPAYFLKALRRHIITGAFSHPRHGGNTQALGWQFLADLLSNKPEDNLFDWRQALEIPLGNNKDYIA